MPYGNTAQKLDMLPNLASDAETFLSSWQRAKWLSDPYPHTILEDLFDPALRDELLDLPFVEYDMDYQAGTREEFNPIRQFITPKLVEKYESARRLRDIFLSPEVITAIEKSRGICLKDTLLRIECTLDKGNFWLKPHTDLGVKLFTLLVYLSDDEDSINWGTDVYRDADTHVKTVPSCTNSGLCFIPSSNTWHGFEPRPIKGVRKTMIVNYVTQEWRERGELTHPTMVVY